MKSNIYLYILASEWTYRLCSVTVYTIILAYLFVRLVGFESGSGIWVLFLVLCELLRLAMRLREGPLELAMGTSFVLLFAFTAPGIYLLQGTDVTLYVALMILFKDALQFVGRSSYIPSRMAWSNFSVSSASSVIAIFLFLGIALGSNVILSGVLAKIGFIAPYAIALIYYECYLRDSNTKRYQSIFVFVLFLVVIAIYVYVFWSGFGRIEIGSFLLIPMLILNFYRDMGIRTMHAILVGPALIFLAQLSRYGSVDSGERLVFGSVGAHITYTDELWGGNTYIQNGGLVAWLDQWVLLFFNWVPRDFWPSKPIGLGYSAVDEWIGRDGFSEGYSISVGFIGEQYYLLGSGFWLGLVVVFITLVSLRIVVQRYCCGYIAPLVMYDVNLMSYFWGGGAAFGSRMFFFIVPAILFLMFVDRFMIRSFKIH